MSDQLRGLCEVGEDGPDLTGVIPLLKDERRLGIRDGTLYLSLWSRCGFRCWVKASIDAPEDDVVIDDLECTLVDRSDVAPVTEA